MFNVVTWDNRLHREVYHDRDGMTHKLAELAEVLSEQQARALAASIGAGARIAEAFDEPLDLDDD